MIYLILVAACNCQLHIIKDATEGVSITKIFVMTSLPWGVRGLEVLISYLILAGSVILAAGKGV